MMSRIVLLLLVGAMAACQTFTTDDENLLLQTQLAAYGTEVVALRDQMQIDRTAVVATVDTMSTQVSDFTRYNSSLAATVKAGIPPTFTPPPFNAEAQGPMALEMFDLSSGEMRFVQIGTAGQIRPDDRCFLSHQNFFDTASTSVIYMTALALNLRAGTQVRVDWQYGGEVVYSNGWTAPQSVDGQCIALELRPSDVPFTPGNWTATMSINGESYDPAPFTITGG